MQCTFLEFLRTNGLIAHNTFVDRLDPGVHFTKTGRKRTSRQKSQIDFLCSTIDQQDVHPETNTLYARPDDKVDGGEATELGKSDHLPVRMTASIQVDHIQRAPTCANAELRKLQWALDPGFYPDKMRYWHYVSSMRKRCDTLQDCIDSVREGVCKIGNAEDVDAPFYERDLEEIETAVSRRKRRKVRHQPGAPLDLEPKIGKRGMNKHILNALAKNTKILDQQPPAVLTLDGVHTADRGNWKCALTELGKAKFTGALDRTENLSKIISECRAVARCNSLDGHVKGLPSFATFADQLTRLSADTSWEKRG